VATSIEKLRTSIDPIVTSLEYSLWGIEMLSKKNGFLVRVYIDCQDRGISVSDCEKVTRQLLDFFEVENFDLGDYTLEVSSPGLDRPLFDLSNYQEMIGEEARVVLFSPFDGKRTVTGIIKGIEGFDVVLIANNEEFVIPFSCIKKAKIVPNYDGM
jgi:ribosome maturation factor RimP